MTDGILTKATVGSAGYDLRARVTIDLRPGDRAVIPTGVTVRIPGGHVGLVCPRSGLAFHHGLTVLNAPGVIDPDFRGEIGVLLHNAGRDWVVLPAGIRIAQLVVVAAPTVHVGASVVEMGQTRGEEGWGSTGLR